MPHDVDGTEYLTIAEAVEVMGCTDGWVRALLSRGELVGRKIGQRLWLVSAASARRARANLTTRANGKRHLAKRPAAKRRTAWDRTADWVSVEAAAELAGCTPQYIRAELARHVPRDDDGNPVGNQSTGGRVVGWKANGRAWLVSRASAVALGKELSSRAVGKRTRPRRPHKRS